MNATSHCARAASISAAVRKRFSQCWKEPVISSAS